MSLTIFAGFYEMSKGSPQPRRIAGAKVVKLTQFSGNDAPPHLIRAATQGRNDNIKRALDAGVPVNYSEPDTGLTALHAAAACGHLHSVALLLKNQASPDEEDRFGRRALDLALETTHVGVIDLLYKVTFADDFGVSRSQVIEEIDVPNMDYDV